MQCIEENFKALMSSEVGEDFAFRILHLHIAPIKREMEAGEKHSEEKRKLSEI